MCCSRVARVRQNARLPSRVLGFADQAARDLADELFLGRDDAGERAAVAGRNRKGLQFAGDDVGVARRFKKSERDRFRENKYQQRPMLVRDLGGLLDILTIPKKFGDWMNDRRHLFAQSWLFRSVEVERPVSA